MPAEIPAPNPIVQLVESLPLPPPPEQKTVESVTCKAAIEMVVAFEIVSPAYYTRHLIKPIWPGGASGPTWCIGYDGGHQLPSTIQADWQQHPHRDQLTATGGVTGAAAKSMVAQLKHITTEIPYCAAVFEQSTVPRYWGMTRRAFPGVDALQPCAQGALFSLVYNRGSGMAGQKRVEMRAIRDDCIPRQDPQCIADQIMAMNRIWKGTDIELGMYRRRQAEARLALQ